MKLRVLVAIPVAALVVVSIVGGCDLDLGPMRFDFGDAGLLGGVCILCPCEAGAVRSCAAPCTGSQTCGENGLWDGDCECPAVPDGGDVANEDAAIAVDAGSDALNNDGEPGEDSSFAFDAEDADASSAD